MVLQSNFKEDISINGYCRIQNGGEFALQEIINELGRVIQEKDIVIEDNPRKWATSTKRMPLHTDHSKADFVAWHCIEQTDSGGETLLSDISIAYNQLTPSQQKLLLNIQLKNVQLFTDDLPLHPFRTAKKSRVAFYYVPWLVQDSESEEVKIILNELNAKVKENATTLLLHKGDVLVIDNKRMLHGRNSIDGTTDRLLKRYWITSNSR